MATHPTDEASHYKNETEELNMKNRRKSLTEKEVRTILTIIECFREQNRYSYDEMNKHMGSMTIKEMLSLNNKLDRWYNPDKYNNEI